ELPHNDQKQAPPYRRAMNLVRGPQVIYGQQEKKNIRGGIGWVNLTEQNRDVPAKEGGPCETNGCDDDEPLVHCRIPPQRVCKPGKHSKVKRVCKRDREKTEHQFH